jgi:hypothetical protein
MASSGHLSKHDVDVQTIPLADCRRLCEQHHYSKGGSNTATYRHGLILRSIERIVGCAWWIPPTKTAAQATYPEGDWRRVLSLSRLAIEPTMPTNAASYLIGRSIRLIRAEGKWDCLVTYADDMQNHSGAIYRATNWEYVGKTKPERAYKDATGRLTARKAGPRTRTHAEMLALGCVCVGSFCKSKFRMVLR